MEVLTYVPWWVCSIYILSLTTHHLLRCSHPSKLPLNLSSLFAIDFSSTHGCLCSSMCSQLGAFRNISFSCWHLFRSISSISILLEVYLVFSILHYDFVSRFHKISFLLLPAITNVLRLSSYPAHHHSPSFSFRPPLVFFFSPLLVRLLYFFNQIPTFDCRPCLDLSIGFCGCCYGVITSPNLLGGPINLEKWGCLLGFSFFSESRLWCLYFFHL